MGTSKTPIIAIVGRPNVGKSTLFNRILGRQEAIVDDLPGVTRDRNYAFVERFSVPFFLVDTGGYDRGSEDELQRYIQDQTKAALQEADIIFCLFDAQQGIHPADQEIVDLLRRYQNPVRYLVNKVDGVEQRPAMNDFYSLGIGDLVDISALHGRNVKPLVEECLQQTSHYESLLAERQHALREEEAAAEIVNEQKEEFDSEEVWENEIGEQEEVSEPVLLDEDAEHSPMQFAPMFLPGESPMDLEEYDRAFRLRSLQEDASTMDESSMGNDEDTESEDVPESLPLVRIAIVGRPNVGKSTLLNTLVGEQRAITSDIAGTTRDSLHVSLRREGQDFLLIDTAGMRKQNKVHDSVEHYSTLRALRSLSQSDVVVLILDATQGTTEQDSRILGLAHEEGRGIVIGVNKWDLIEKDHTTVKSFKDDLKEAFKFAPYAPIVFLSAKTGRRCPNLLDTARRVALTRNKRVSTNHVNRVLKRATKRVSAPTYRGQPVKLYYASQVDTCPPRFVLFFNFPSEVHFSYLRFLKNALREAYVFEGTDIKFVLKKRGKS